MAWLRKEQSASRGFDDDEGSRFAQPGFIASALVILFVVLSAVYLVVAGDDGKPASGPSQLPPTAPVVAPVTLDPVPDGAGDPKGSCPFIAAADTSRPVQAPSNVTWQSFRTVSLPFSSVAGPLVSQGDRARCYAQTPTGALLAVAQITTRYVLADGWQMVLLEQVMPGAGADAYSLPRIEKELVHGGARLPDPDSMSQIAGFKFVNYSSLSAAVEIARRNPDGTLQAFVHTVVWKDGDWKLELQPDGADSSSGRGLISLEGFIPWGDA